MTFITTDVDELLTLLNKNIEEIESIVFSDDFKAHFGDIRGEQLKTAPVVFRRTILKSNGSDTSNSLPFISLMKKGQVMKILGYFEANSGAI